MSKDRKPTSFISAAAKMFGRSKMVAPAPPDPAKILFPAAGGEFGGDQNLPLGTQLEKCAHDIKMRNDALRSGANDLITAIAARNDAEISLAAQSLRFVIGLVWLGVAAWLYINGLNARAEDIAVLTNGMPAENAFVLSQTFFIVAAAALGVAMGVASLVRVSGNADNRRVRRAATQLGNKIADVSAEFDTSLTALREAMDRRANASDAIVELSRAHLTALEASAFFREIAFVTGADDSEAALKFRGFLSRPPAPVPPLPVLLIGFILGAFVVFYGWVPRPESTGAAATPLAITQYPWAYQLLLGGGFLYAIAGIAGQAFSGVFAAGADASARNDALDALRGAFTSHGAPRPIDVIRRIEDAVDVFRARVGGRRDVNDAGLSASELHRQSPAYARKSRAAADGRFDDPDSQEPSWRNPDSSLKFVKTAFSLAPKSWRTDAYAKKLLAEQAREPAAKRGRAKLKNNKTD